MENQIEKLTSKIDALEKQVAALVRLQTPEGKRHAALLDAQSNPNGFYPQQNTMWYPENGCGGNWDL
jgi:hypothetical protein